MDSIAYLEEEKSWCHLRIVLVKEVFSKLRNRLSEQQRSDLSSILVNTKNFARTESRRNDAENANVEHRRARFKRSKEETDSFKVLQSWPALLKLLQTVA